MSINAIVRFDEFKAAAEEYFLPEEKLISGNPKQTVWKHYADQSGKFFAGVWQSEVGKWNVSYTEEEYCRILDGRSVISDQKGKTMLVSAGDSFIIPAGFVGTWEVLETTRKTYVIYEA